MPLRPCVTCGELTRSGSYCSAHRPRSPSSRATGRRSWTSIRAQAIMRDGRRCVRCGSIDGLQVHHVVPVHEGGKNALSNAITLCEQCHAAEHRPTGPRAA